MGTQNAEAGLTTLGHLHSYRGNISSAVALPKLVSQSSPQGLEANITSLPQMAEKSNCHKTLCGPLIPVVTHFNRDFSLDLSALRENLRYLLEHGIRTGAGCLLVGGAGGDFPMLSREERRAVVCAAVETVAGRAPVVIGAQGTDARVVVELAKLADEVGVYAIQVSPPYYYEPSDEDVLRWFRFVNDSLKKTGIMVYNTYWHGYNFPLEVLDKVIELDRAVSLKWSTPYGGLDYMEGVARYARKVAVVDNALMWPLTFLTGGCAFITHLGNVWPQCVVQIYATLKEGKYKESTDSMREKKWPWARFRAKIAKQTSGEAPPVRCALELCGRPGGASRPPSRDLNSQERAELRAVLSQIGAPLA